MKKLAIFAISLVLGMASTMAQGTIVFGNSSATAFKLKVTDGVVTNVVGTANTIGGLGPQSVRVALLVGANNANIGTLTPLTATTGNLMVSNTISGLAAVQGTFTGGNVDSGLAIGNIEYLYIAWSVSSGYLTGLEALNAYLSGNWNGYVGSSGIIQNYPTGGGSVLPPQTFGTAQPYQISGITLAQSIVPEPTTFALMGLGAASLLVIRRRK